MALKLKEAKGIYVDDNQRVWVAIDSIEHNGELRKGVEQVVLIETRNYSKVTSDFALPEKAEAGLDLDALKTALKDPEVVKVIQELMPKPKAKAKK